MYKGSQMTFQPTREDMGKEDRNATCLFSGGHFKCAVGVVIIWWTFSGAKSRLRQLSGEELGVKLPPKHPVPGL